MEESNIIVALIAAKHKYKNGLLFISQLTYSDLKEIHKRKELISVLKDYILVCSFIPENFYNYRLQLYCKYWIDLYIKSHGNIFNRF